MIDPVKNLFSSIADVFMKICAIFKREVFTLLDSAAAWVFLVIFATLSGVMTFQITDILSLGQADLAPFFHWLPQLFIFVIPALAMPLWAEERRAGTLDLSLSYPVSMAELVIGKFLAGEFMLVLALAMTLGTPLTIAYYGEPDINAVICGYLGAFMVGTVFLAISCFCSAVTRSQTASFLLSLVICFLLIVTGYERISVDLTTYLPVWLSEGVNIFSVSPHYQAFQRGLIDSTEIAYAVLMTVLFLYLTHLALKISTSGTGSIFLPGTWLNLYTWKQVGKLLSGIVIIFYIFFALMYCAKVFHFRIDATADKAYTLMKESEAVAQQVAKNKKVIEIRLYISANMEKTHPELYSYSRRVEWLLKEFAQRAEGYIRLSMVSVEEHSSEDDAAKMDGLQPVIQTEMAERVYLGLAVSSGLKVVPIRQLTPDREMLLEYDLVRAIREVTNAEKPVLGVLSTLSVLGREASAGNSGTKMMNFAEELSKDYELRTLTTDIAEIPAGLDVLLVFHPVNFDNRLQYAIDQYIMRGGRVAIFLDPAMRSMGLQNPTLLSSGLDKLSAAWGISYDPEKKAADANYKYTPPAVGGARRIFPDVLDIPAEGLAKDSPVTRALTHLLMPFPASFAIKEKAGLSYEILAHTSAHSGTYPAKMPSEAVYMELSADPNARTAGEIPMVIAITGTFQSAFNNSTQDAAALDSGKTHLQKSTGSPKVVLFGDCDMLYRTFTHDITVDESGNRKSIPLNDNIALLQNVLEDLNGDVSLAQLRSRKPMSRPLTKILERKKEAEAKFTEKIGERKLEFDIRRHRAEQIKLKLVRQASRISAEEKRELDEFSLYKSNFEREIKEIRNELKGDLDAYNISARRINIFLIPGALVVLAFLWGIFRFIMRKGRNSKCKQ